MSYDPAVPDELYPAAAADPATPCAGCGHPRSEHRMALASLGRDAYCEHENHDDFCACPAWAEPDKED